MLDLEDYCKKQRYTFENSIARKLNMIRDNYGIIAEAESLETLMAYRDRDNFKEIGDTVIVHSRSHRNADIIIETARLFRKYINQDVSELNTCLREIFKTNMSDEGILQYLEIADQYFDNHLSDITMVVLERYVYTSTRINRLKVDKAFEGIKKSKKPKELITHILRHDFSEYDKYIRDVDVWYNINYNDMSHLFATLDFVMEIHNNKSLKHREDVFLGFYQELNRAIEQGNTLEEKMELLYEYCREVKEKLVENVGELMYSA